MEALEFPEVPRYLLSGLEPRFKPCREVGVWARRHLIDASSPIVNPEHAHLDKARILWLWASYTATAKGGAIGEAQLNLAQSAAYSQGRSTAMLRDWNGGIHPDFIITLSAPWFAEADEVSKCAVIDHELFHCAQKRNKDGERAFDRLSDRPQWAIRHHDLEEFVGIARRYGAWSPQLQQMKSALEHKPLIGRPLCVGACSCGAVIGDPSGRL